MILIKKHRLLAGIMAFLFIAFVSVGITQQMGYFPFNGNTFKIRSGATQTVESGGIVDFSSGSYLKIATTAMTASAAELNYIDGTILGTAVASKVLGLGSTRNVNYLAVGDTLLGDSAVLRMNTGSTLQIDSGASMTISGVTVTTSNLWTGTQSAVALLADSTLLSGTSGSTYIARPVAAKARATLPAAAAGLNYVFFVADADSLLLTAATGDSLIDNTGAAYVTTSSVAGSVKIVALDGVRWFMFPYVGTWTSY